MKSKILLLCAVVLSAVAILPMFAAFEAHVINVTAKIENALTVPIKEITFGTVFPQEQLDEVFSIFLSNSFKAEDRVDDVEYAIRQKPKCGLPIPDTDPLQYSEFSRAVEDENGNFICEKANGGHEMLPLLCPYLSKHIFSTDHTANDDQVGMPAFHGLPGPWTLSTTIATQVRGRLAKSDQNFVDSWEIDLRVPCFQGHCAQDWDTFVRSINPAANPRDYIVDPKNERQLFGCDVWLEVLGISEVSSQLPGPIVSDDFNGYSNGSVVGQGGWSSYVNGGNFTVQGTTVFEGAKALHVNALADSVINKAGTPLSDGRQAVYVRTENRGNWGFYEDGNAQFRVIKGSWGGSELRSFAAVSFRSNGHVAYYDPVTDDYLNFATYNDNEWTLLEIEWRSSDTKARFRVNKGTWTDWKPIAGSGSFTDFDHVGFDFFLPSGSGGVYFDTLK